MQGLEMSPMEVGVLMDPEDISLITHVYSHSTTLARSSTSYRHPDAKQD